ncbi:hypothetical protein AAG570_007032, partial [Ranatra chinensis]
FQALIHVSTAYCNCDRDEVNEEIYPPPYDPENIIQAMEWMDDELIQALTPKLIGKRPNTYTFTKALTEYILSKESGNLPVAIVRPSIGKSSEFVYKIMSNKLLLDAIYKIRLLYRYIKLFHFEVRRLPRLFFCGTVFRGGLRREGKGFRRFASHVGSRTLKILIYP